MQVDKSNTVTRYDGHSVWVAPLSLAAHGLRKGQRLTKDQWRSLGNKLAAEWVAYVQACDEATSQ